MKVSEYAKQNGLSTQEAMEKFGLTHHAQNVPEEVIIMNTEEEVAAEAPEVKPEPKKDKKKEKGVVTFYWREGKNATFTVAGEVIGGVQQNGTFYKSERSVLRLDEKADAKAIAKLRGGKGNEANGGTEYGEFDISDLPKSEEGTTMDKLMSMSIESLAALAGVSQYGTTKGKLICEIMGLKG